VGLEQRLLRKFAQQSALTFEDGDLIFAEGDTGNELYIIQDGKVIITKSTPKGELELVTFEKGDFFGEMSLFQSIPRYASARAVGSTKLIVLQPGGILLKIRRDPTFAFEMLQQLSFRIKVSNERLIETIRRSNLSSEEIQSLLKEVGAV
jgi:CRP-like cAMP-binding protein